MYFQAKDTSYWYEIHGEGTPVVLLHGFTGSSASWKELINMYPEGIQWIIIDLPGHGKTKSKVIKTMNQCCDDLHELLNSLKLDDHFMLGYSMGGRTALSFASMYPENILGLILESASPGLQTNEEREARRKQDARLVERLEKEGLQSFVDFWQDLPLFATQKSLPIQKQLMIREARMNASVEGLVASLIGMGTGAQPSNWESLKALPFPVLLIVGELDEKFVQINKRMQVVLPNAVLQKVAEAGHTIHVEKPRTYGKIVTEFIEHHE